MIYVVRLLAYVHGRRTVESFNYANTRHYRLAPLNPKTHLYTGLQKSTKKWVKIFFGQNRIASNPGQNPNRRHNITVVNIKFPLESKKRKMKSTNTTQFPSIIMFFRLLYVHLILLTVAILAEQSPNNEPADNNFIFDCDASTAMPSNSQRWYPRYSYKLTVSRASIQNSGDDLDQFPNLEVCIYHKQHTYTFQVSAGMHYIRLHFHPISYGQLDIFKALFSVSVGPYTLLTTSVSSYSRDVSDIDFILKEFCINVHGSVLNLTFTPLTNSSSDAYGFVNKIEIVSMPPNLYVRPLVALPLINNGHPSKFVIGNSTALEMVYRLNVGGHFIPAADDTGMFRVWSEDTPYLDLDLDANYTSIVRSSKVNNIMYTSSVPEYTAPLKVYATARTTADWVDNLSWLLPLESGFYYLIRLHFCEITIDIKHENQRVFQISINNQTAEDHADVIQWSGGASIPVYRDYVVNFSRFSQEIQYLSLELKTIHSGAILNGLEIFKLSDHSNNLAGLYPFSKWRSDKPNKSSMIISMTAAILSGFFICLLVISLVYYALRFCLTWLCPSSSLFSLLRYSKWERRTFMQWALMCDHCRYFSLAEIKSATNNFSDANLIGAGGFGKVYKGCIDSDEATTVAIKRGSSTSNQGLHEFQTEITMLSKLRHRHLVPLIGYCIDDKEMILVYDFMARGTLRDHLYNTQNPPLPWKQRLQICIDAARGLQYLHAGAKQTIIHRDVKTTNLLLDKRWVAKVADFGLSKIGPNMLSHTHVTTIVKGSFGYLDPEYYRRQKLTEKSDVYSFGVVLFEVLCARPAVLPMVMEEDQEELEQANLAEWALHCNQIGTLDQIVDPCLRGKIDPECFKTFTEVAKKCLADRGFERPPMSEVLWNLELAWQQQEGADAEREQRTCDGTSTRIAGDVAVMIDGQQVLRTGNSDPTPGAEFSEIMAPVGR